MKPQVHPNVFYLNGVAYGGSNPPLIVAELSGNHQQSLDTALALVDAAADCGVDAIKLQTYTADTMTLDVEGPGFTIEDDDSLWKGESLHALYDKAHTPWAWHQAVFQRAAERGLLAFSTPFDATAVDFLESLDVPCYKIASFEMTDLPLVRRVAETGKPMIVSTGMASDDEIAEMLAVIASANARPPVLLKCTSTYPSTAENANLRTMPDMHRRFDVPVGLSDHSLGIGVAVAATALGACVIEKHFVLSRNSDAVDAAFSMEPEEMRQLVEECRRAHAALGRVHYGGAEAEQASFKFRRSIYVAQDIAEGDTLTGDNLKVIRPGYGLPPKDWDRVLGRRAAVALRRGTPLAWTHVADDE